MAGWMPSWAELTALIAALSTALWQWIERRDEHSALSLAKTEAEKTVASQKMTIDEKNNEIRELKADRDRLERRVAHLESLLYSRGGTQ